MALATLEFQDSTHDSITSPPYWWGVFGDLWEWIFSKHQQYRSYTLTLQPLTFLREKSKGNPQKSKVCLSAEALKFLEKRRNARKKQGRSETKKARKKKGWRVRVVSPIEVEWATKGLIWTRFRRAIPVFMFQSGPNQGKSGPNQIREGVGARSLRKS